MIPTTCDNAGSIPRLLYSSQTDWTFGDSNSVTHTLTHGTSYRTIAATPPPRRPSIAGRYDENLSMSLGTVFRIQVSVIQAISTLLYTAQHCFYFVGFLSKSATSIRSDYVRQKIFTYWNVHSYRRSQTALPVTVRQTVVDNHALRGSASPVLTATGFVNGRGQFSTSTTESTPLDRSSKNLLLVVTSATPTADRADRYACLSSIVSVSSVKNILRNRVIKSIKSFRNPQKST